MHNAMVKKNLIKKGIQVKVICGDDKGKIGEVLKVDLLKNLVKVSGVNIQTHFQKKTEQTLGGIHQTEGWIQISNVSYITKDKKATKVSKIKTENGFKIISRKTKEEIIVYKKKDVKNKKTKGVKNDND